jgi:hypothetical protein
MYAYIQCARAKMDMLIVYDRHNVHADAEHIGHPPQRHVYTLLF